MTEFGAPEPGAPEPGTPEFGATRHLPVMLSEVLAALSPEPGQILVDGTAGGGGHLRQMAERVGPDGWVLGIDRDPAAIERLETSLAGMCVKLACGSYNEVASFLEAAGADRVNGMLLDLGLSSDQLADPARGFSFNIDGPLDLRFNPEVGEPASRLVNRMAPEKLADLIYAYGEERHSRRIARAIAEQRRKQPIESAAELAAIVTRSVPRSRQQRIHPATRTFQALRIAVNQELEHLSSVLDKLPRLIAPGGIVAVISFHSLEDRIVKRAFRDNGDVWSLEPRKPILPSETELAQNPRSRSAKLRVAVRLPDR